jgi:hypothetical protein
VLSWIIIFFIVVLGGDILWHLKKFLIYHTWIHPLHCSPLFSPHLTYGIVTTGIFIAITYMCTHFLDCIHPPNPFPQQLPAPTGASPSLLVRTCSTFLFSNFAEQKRENMTFLFVWDKSSYTGSFLVVFPHIYIWKYIYVCVCVCVCVCYTSSWFIFS